MVFKRCHAFLLVLLVAPAECRGGSGDGGSGRRNFWGRCDRLNRCQAACRRQQQQLSCSSRMSDGPTDADVEIQLANLPASTASESVHLHWWAPRKSPTHYDPLTSLVGCSVYRDMRAAYPSIYHSDFNGGNVRVSETGTATIRVRAPSTFYVWRYIAIPHVNLRLCTGSNPIRHKLPDASFYFGSNETWIKQRNSTTATIQVTSAAPYAARVASTNPVSGPKPVAVIVAARVHAPQTTTTLRTTTMNEEQAQVLIDAARDALSLDALEFSPVYECFLLNKFFDHFSSDCAERCQDGSKVAHGQCVRPATEAANAELSSTWKLTINCSPGRNCWDDQNTTLHRARLAAAGHLTIPFQEVSVTVSYDWSGSSRRLLEARELYLTVDATTQRWTQGEGNRLLSDFVSDHESIGEILDVTVLQAQIHTSGGSFSNIRSMSELNDPYSPAYEALKPASRTDTPNSIVGLLPPAAIAGIACGAVAFLAAAVVGIVCYRRHKQKKAREAVAQSKMANNNKDPDAKIESNKVEEEAPEATDSSVYL